MILPILLYGCEVWGHENTAIIEKKHLKFLKLASGLKMSTPNYMVYGELGRTPLSININKRMIAFWRKLTETNIPIKLSCMLNTIIKDDNIVKNYNLKWLNHIKTTLNDCGLTYLFNNHKGYKLELLVEQILTDQFTQKWKAEIQTSSKGLFYKHFKNSLHFENYLLLPNYISKPLLKIRTTNHKLPIETGRWENIPKENRTCKLCNSPAVADELHYLLNCQACSTLRSKHLHKYLTWSNPISIKRIMNQTKISDLKRISKFINEMFNLVK